MSNNIKVIVDRTKIERELEDENRLLREKLLVLEAREQALRDTIPRETMPKGGGVVQLQSPQKRMVYPTAREGITDLYMKMDKGDKNAEDTLRRLWAKSREALLNIERNGMAIVGCPKCKAGLELVSKFDGKCPSCGFNMYEFRMKGGEW